MLKLKIFENKKFNIPETIVEADNIVDLLKQHFDLLPLVIYKDADANLKQVFKLYNIDIKTYFKRHSIFVNNIFLANYLVENNLAKWLEKTDDLLNPETASRIYKNSALKRKETVNKRIAARKEFVANLTPEDKSKHFQYLKVKTKKDKKLMSEGMCSFWANMSKEEKEKFLAERGKKISAAKNKKTI